MASAEQFDPAERRLWSHVKRTAADPCPDPLLLAAYVDGLASEAETKEAEAHLAACPRCLETIAETQRLTAAPPVIAPAGVAARAKALVPPAAQARSVRWFRYGRWAAAAAAVAAVAYLGFVSGDAAGRRGIDLTEVLVQEATFGLADPWGEAEMGDELAQALSEDRP